MRLSHIPRILVLVVVIATGIGLMTNPALTIYWTNRILFGLISLSCPLFFLFMLLAPGAFLAKEKVSHFWQRIVSRRRDITELQYKVKQLGHAHHMRQLGDIYLSQGKYAKAEAWYRQAVEKDPDLLDPQYKLGVCLLENGSHTQAIELLEKVHETKPEHDYGSAYLQLAKAHLAVGNVERAESVLNKMLRYYPGHPEATFRHGEVLSELGQTGQARTEMGNVIDSVKRSPTFKRSDNRHWLWKARWWLWQNRN